MTTTIVDVKSSKPVKNWSNEIAVDTPEDIQRGVEAMRPPAAGCPECGGTGWKRSIPDDPASARMTCRCKRRFGSTADA